MPFHQCFVLAQRERVHRTHQAQLAFEFARPGRERDPFGHFRRGRGERGVGFAVELVANPFDRLLES